jgi:hypothetical protein
MRHTYDKKWEAVTGHAKLMLALAMSQASTSMGRPAALFAIGTTQIAYHVDVRRTRAAKTADPPPCLCQHLSSISISANEHARVIYGV